MRAGPSPATPDAPGNGAGGSLKQVVGPVAVYRGTRLTVGPLARPEEASGRRRAESPIEPWSAVRDPSACKRPMGSGVDTTR